MHLTWSFEGMVPGGHSSHVPANDEKLPVQGMQRARRLSGSFPTPQAIHSPMPAVACGQGTQSDWDGLSPWPSPHLACCTALVVIERQLLGPSRQMATPCMAAEAISPTVSASAKVFASTATAYLTTVVNVALSGSSESGSNGPSVPPISRNAADSAKPSKSAAAVSSSVVEDTAYATKTCSLSVSSLHDSLPSDKRRPASPEPGSIVTPVIVTVTDRAVVLQR